jgi:predicted metal-dependent HD superfamily phosphohydrolase
MTYQQLADRAAPYVMNLFSKYDTTSLIFHNLEHTTQVNRHAAEIADVEKVEAEDKLVLHIATLFHDTGHLNGGMEDHEQRGVTFMEAFMSVNNIHDEVFIKRVARCILATQMPHNPSGKLEEIMCDADIYHLGTDEFKVTNKKIRKEFEKRGYDHLTKGWLKHTYQLLNDQHFYTAYCRERLEAGKENNIAFIKKKMEKKGLLPAVIEDVKMSEEIDPEALASPEDTKMNQRLIARGVQTVLRLSSQNHLELSQMADGKANILISVNAIIISVILSVLINRLEVNTHLTIPTILFLTSSVVTIVISILATRPKLTEGTFRKEDVINKKTNLLFFGNFYKSSLPDFTWAMKKLLVDKEYIHGTQIMDVYYLGQVLGRKYRLIRLAYTIFMVGIVVAVVAFTIAVLSNIPKGNLTIVDGAAKPF